MYGPEVLSVFLELYNHHQCHFRTFSSPSKPIGISSHPMATTDLSVYEFACSGREY